MRTDEDQMSRTLSSFLLALSLLIVLYLGSSLMGTATMLAAAADRFHAGSGQILFFVLLGTMGLLVLYAVVLYFSFPPALIPPKDSAGPKFERYQIRLLNHLNKIRRSKGLPDVTTANIPTELECLKEDATKITRDMASSIFVSTAVLQNGRLDGLVVLGTQLRLVWQVAKVYHLRPTLRQLAYLYGNVSLSVITAQSIDDVDFAELSAPIVTAVIPSLKGAIPGLQGLASLLVNSLSSGAANAMMTLRIGSIAQQYCALQPGTSESVIRPNATRFAVSQIGIIVKEKGTLIAGAAFDAIVGPVAEAVGNTKDSIQQAMKNATDGIVDAGNWTAERVSGAVQGARFVVGQGVGVASEMAFRVKDVATPAATATGQVIASSATTARDAAVNVALTVKDVTVSGVSRVSGVLVGAGEVVGNIGSQAAGATLNAARELANATTARVGALKDKNVE